MSAEYEGAIEIREGLRCLEETQEAQTARTQETIQKAAIGIIAAVLYRDVCKGELEKSVREASRIWIAIHKEMVWIECQEKKADNDV